MGTPRREEDLRWTRSENFQVNLSLIRRRDEHVTSLYMTNQFVGYEHDERWQHSSTEERESKRATYTSSVHNATPVPVWAQPVGRDFLWVF